MVPMPYLREILLYHLVYNPILYMIRSREFSSTLAEKWRRILHRQLNLISDNRRPVMLTAAHQAPPTAALD